jgi:predicted acyltransferase
MTLMMAEVLEFRRLARAFPDNPAWRWLAYHQSHVAWAGCSIHDMIQPSFSFLVGVALPFSLASRARRGEPLAWSVLHAAWRAVVLVALGIFLRSVGKGATNFTFEDTLTQIGLGYFPLFLLGLGKPWVRVVAFVTILVGVYAAFTLYPAPGADFDYPSVAVPADWPHHGQGLAAHWNKNSNLAWAFDGWFLNQFPRETAWKFNDGGYATLSFIPTLATMLLGALAGDGLRAGGPRWRKPVGLMLAGAACAGLGLLAEQSASCPIVKRIWTPSWVLFSGGICLGVLGWFHALLDLANLRGVAYPLMVVGRNSIAAYLLSHLIVDFLVGTYHTHLGPKAFQVFGPEYEPLTQGATVLATLWLVLFWMDRRGIYLRV